MASIFADLLKRAARVGLAAATKASKEWFRNTALRVTGVTGARLFADQKNLKKNIRAEDIGSMFMYFYDPKLKDTLPYYDKLPLVIIVDMTADGFYGLNLHYLPPVLRAKLMDALWELRNNDKYDETTKLKISYQILKGVAKYKYYAPCFKRYLYSHVRSSFLYINPSDWDKALMLPTERFEKATKEQVFDDSRRRF